MNKQYEHIYSFYHYPRERCKVAYDCLKQVAYQLHNKIYDIAQISCIIDNKHSNTLLTLLERFRKIANRIQEKSLQLKVFELKQMIKATNASHYTRSTPKLLFTAL